jgi:uncharacterized protein YdiU (UPF0061 family)
VALLPRWDPAFTAAYFDHSGLYAFGRQPEALHWNCGSWRVAAPAGRGTEPLVAALNRFGPLYARWRCAALLLAAGAGAAG